MLPCLSACLLPCFHSACFSASCFSASIFHACISQCFHASMLPCCHVPVAPLPWFCGRLPFSHPLLNPSCFLSPSVFRTRTHERPRLRPRGPFPLSRPDVSCRLHTVTVSQTSTSPPQPGC
ncbi:uncharacterized protein K444DRAFT_314933 [Hyaloscypha bicolor E]|uniref:Secreted protein n=1 Tax=Hyaloscypha bicolor E TaxID=1095630 RepID=A0A2J6TM79_9HELO|nr:uncharacterized protein K444DRAFT_314933 [Hyaloscypha bicolor E]PMD64107.1 hypothetical protein K444DRAFT_314933 [Hyaloscypha bicolor E]